MNDGTGIIEDGEFRFLGYDEVGDVLLEPMDDAYARAYPREAFDILPVNAETLVVGTFVAVDPLVAGRWVLREFCDCWDPWCLGIECREDWYCDCDQPDCPADNGGARPRHKEES